MFRRLLLGALLMLGLFATAAANAAAFNPATQSHWGACARETDRVAQAVHDYTANGVAIDFARLLNLRGAKQLRRHLVLGEVTTRTVTRNHGCDGAGHWFAVGSRALNRGERVAVRLGNRLRRRACVRSHRGCRRITIRAHVVFPINCWNPNMGAIEVAVYVRKASQKTRARKVKRTLKPVRYLPPPAPPTPEAPPPTPSAKTAEPLASAALSCGAAAVNVTISDAATATAPASFDVQGTAHGPLAPGSSETIVLPLTPGEKLTLTVTSGTATLIGGEQIVNDCKAEPIATAKLVGCAAFQEVQEGFGAEISVTLANGPIATLPTAPFTVEWEAPGPTFGSEPVPMSETVGSLNPGEQKTLTLVLEALEPSAVTVTSGGQQILKQTFVARQCIPG